VPVRKLPRNPQIEAFEEASFYRKPTRADITRMRADRPLLELATPGLVALFDILAQRHPRRVRRIRRDLTWAYNEARKTGVLP
jgi:hypothetical protein